MGGYRQNTLYQEYRRCCADRLMLSHFSVSCGSASLLLSWLTFAILFKGELLFGQQGNEHPQHQTESVSRAAAGVSTGMCKVKCRIKRG